MKALKQFLVAMIPATIAFTGPASIANATAAPTLWGIYGLHNRHDCPVNNRDTAKEVITLSAMDLHP